MDETLSDRLRVAIDAGDLEAVRHLIDLEPALLRANIRPGPNRDYRPLTEAAVECRLEILDFLISSGCDVREDQNYPMFRACLYDRCIPAIETLARHGALIDGVWADYGPPAIAACEGMAPGCMRWLLERGARIAGSGPGATREVAWNAVTHAAHFYKWRPEVLEIVLEFGGDVNSQGTREGTPLHAAARHGDVKGVRFLLGRGADPTRKDPEGRRPIEVTRNRRVAEILMRAE